MPHIELSPAALRDLGNLDAAVKQRVDQRLEAVGRGDIQGKPLKGDFKGVFSVRVGDWRELYRQVGPDLLEIARVQHRREVYRAR